MLCCACAQTSRCWHRRFDAVQQSGKRQSLQGVTAFFSWAALAAVALRASVRRATAAFPSRKIACNQCTIINCRISNTHRCSLNLHFWRHFESCFKYKKNVAKDKQSCRYCIPAWPVICLHFLSFEIEENQILKSLHFSPMQSPPYIFMQYCNIIHIRD